MGRRIVIASNLVMAMIMTAAGYAAIRSLRIGPVQWAVDGGKHAVVAAALWVAFALTTVSENWGKRPTRFASLHALSFAGLTLAIAVFASSLRLVSSTERIFNHDTLIVQGVEAESMPTMVDYERLCST